MPWISITVNGISRTVDPGEGRVTLLDILRDRLGLLGSKLGCGVGQCGSCTVLMNGEAVTSCTVPALKADGAEVLTIEALADGQRLHPIQQAFIDAGAIQCGFCTPGLVMRAYGLLTKNPKAGEEEIRAALNKHLCRCTGYETILEAIKLAQMRIRQS